MASRTTLTSWLQDCKDAQRLIPSLAQPPLDHLQRDLNARFKRFRLTQKRKRAPVIRAQNDLDEKSSSLISTNSAMRSQLSNENGQQTVLTQKRKERSGAEAPHRLPSPPPRAPSTSALAVAVANTR